MAQMLETKTELVSVTDMTGPKKALTDWAISRIGGKKAKVLGHVVARDAGSAVQRAIIELDVRPRDQNRLLAVEVRLGDRK